MIDSEELVYGCGFVESELDGTEYCIEDIAMYDVPEEFTYRDVMPPILDQGKSSKCVCYSLTSMLDWEINRFEEKTDSNHFDIDELYDCRKRKFINGMEVKEAMRYLKHHGLGGVKITGYAMIRDFDQMKKAILAYGPILAGLPVCNNGPSFWKSGRQRGGHAVVIVGWTKDAFIVRNSWGDDWADHGYSLMPFDDFSKFLEAWVILGIEKN